MIGTEDQGKVAIIDVTEHGSAHGGKKEEHRIIKASGNPRV